MRQPPYPVSSVTGFFIVACISIIVLLDAPDFYTSENKQILSLLVNFDKLTKRIEQKQTISKHFSLFCQFFRNFLSKVFDYQVSFLLKITLNFFSQLLDT